MRDRKLTQTDLDFQELECALSFAQRGQHVHWTPAKQALVRLIRLYSKNLGKTYNADLIEEIEPPR